MNTANMPIFIAAAAESHRAESEYLYRDPAFRKATIPMLMACRAAEKALLQLTKEPSQLQKKDWGLVFGTSHGELEVTNEFLLTLENKGLARPILFQNSLHHSTLGFLSLRYGVSGPGVTVSNHFFSGEDALSTAIDLIESGSCDIAMTIAVDGLVPALARTLGQYYPEDIPVGEGAGCLIITNDEGAQSLGINPNGLATLCDISYQYLPETNDEGHSSIAYSVYDADAVEQLARLHLRLIEHNHRGQHTMKLSKPDGTYSIVTLTSPAEGDQK